MMQSEFGHSYGDAQNKRDEMVYCHSPLINDEGAEVARAALRRPKNQVSALPR
jgi:hypothetical protein